MKTTHIRITKMPKGNFHPSRTSGHQKMLRAKAANELIEKEKKPPMKKIDLKKNDWSLKP